jgi:gliding motility-associated lipoprotein GldH
MRYIILLATIVVFTACGPNYLFEEEKDIQTEGWTYADTLDFRFSIADTAALYNLSVAFSYADTFPNQNVYIKFYTKFPDGKRLSKPLSFDLFDPEGKPAGKCSGGTCSTNIPIQQNAFFEKPGEYVITLEQFGRREALPGIKTIGLMVEKTEKMK